LLLLYTIQFSSLHFTSRHQFAGPPPNPLSFTNERICALLVAVAVCLPMTGLPFGTTFLKTTPLWTGTLTFRCSIDFEQTLPGGHLARRGVWVCTSPSGYVTAFGEACVPTPGLEQGVRCNPRVTFDGKVRNLGSCVLKFDSLLPEDHGSTRAHGVITPAVGTRLPCPSQPLEGGRGSVSSGQEDVDSVVLRSLVWWNRKEDVF